MEKSRKIKKILSRPPLSTAPNGALCFVPEKALNQARDPGGLKAGVQEKLKLWPRLYHGLVDVCAPVLASRAFRHTRRELLTRAGADQVVVNLGSGPWGAGLGEDVIEVDIQPFPRVDVVADAADLPFEDGSVDLFFCVAMLEHVERPEEVVAQMHRKLKRGGKAFGFVPFMQPFHSAPGDFHRWTEPGLKILVGDFSKIRTGVGAGPASAALWIMEHWLAMAMSLGSARLYDLLFMGLASLLWPLKLLDLLLERHPRANELASGFFFAVEK